MTSVELCKPMKQTGGFKPDIYIYIRCKNVRVWVFLPNSLFHRFFSTLFRPGPQPADIFRGRGKRIATCCFI